MSILFSSFVFYSFAGFLLECSFSRLMRDKKPDRKCYLFAPLCPVYGLGAVAILSLPPFITENSALLFLAGGLTASTVEYLTGLFYERGVGVRFWDYRALPANLGGRVCLLFSIAWGLLACLLVYGLHPLLLPFFASIHPVPLLVLFVLLSTDGILSLLLLHRSGSTESLKWYTPRTSQPL